MRSRGVRLEYSFQPDDQHGADVHNPLFELLSAVREHGSIQHAAKALGAYNLSIVGRQPIHTQNNVKPT